MKTKMLLTSLVAAGLFCATAFQSSAQAPGGGGMPGALTQEQRTKLRESVPQDMTEKLTAAQKEAVTAALAKNADEKTVRAKVEAVAKIQTEIAMLRFKALKDVALTDEQKTAMESRAAMSYGTLLGGGFGGGMGAGGRRGGGGNK